MTIQIGKISIEKAMESDRIATKEISQGKYLYSL
jgi:hypothetical protein